MLSLTQLESIRGCNNLEGLNLAITTCFRLKPLPEGVMDTVLHLTRLDFNRCADLQHVPENIGNCLSLTFFDMGYCSTLRKLPDSIKRCTCLANLVLEGCTRLEQLPESLGFCSRLSELRLQGCVCLVQLPESISKCNQLSHLDLRGCVCLEPLPLSFSEFPMFQRYAQDDDPNRLPPEPAMCMDSHVHLDRDDGQNIGTARGHQRLYTVTFSDSTPTSSSGSLYSINELILSAGLKSVVKI